MTVRAWATLAVRCFAFYHIFFNAVYILWVFGARIVGAGASMRGIPESGPELVSTLLFSALNLAAAAVLLALSDGTIRFIARVPGEADRPAAPPAVPPEA